MRRLAVLLLVAFLALSLGTGVTPSSGAAEVTPGLLEARAEAARLAEQLDEAESELARIEDEIAGLEQERADAEARLDALRGALEELAVDQYTQGASRPLIDIDVDRQARAEALAEIVSQHDTDTLDQVRAIRAQLAANATELEQRRSEQQDVLDQLEARSAELQDQLARLEQLEIQRLEEERLAAEREARQAAEAEARAAAQARADRLAREQAARQAGQQVAAQPAAATAAAPAAPAPATPVAPIVAAPAAGSIACPVPGAVYRDSWGEPRSGGRAHRGIDMMAATGTPIVAPISGTVVHGYDTLGGNNFNLTGDNGWSMYGAHLSANGQAGHVSAGTVIGYVGETGNAQGAHLHFEIHIGGTPVNPYPYVAAAC